MSLLKCIYLLLFTLLINGCANIKPLEVKYQKMEGSGFYSTSAATKSSIVKHKNDEVIVCAEPAPDATFNDQGGGSVGLSMLHIGDQASGGASDGETEAGLGGRSVNVLLTRVMYFRMCEFFANTNLSDSLKVEIYKNTIQSILQLNKQNFGVGTNNRASSQASYQESNNLALPNISVADSTSNVKKDTTATSSKSKDCNPFEDPNCSSK